MRGNYGGSPPIIVLLNAGGADGRMRSARGRQVLIFIPISQSAVRTFVGSGFVARNTARKSGMGSGPLQPMRPRRSPLRDFEARA
jgi:hypothetical protein